MKIKLYLHHEWRLRPLARLWRYLNTVSPSIPMEKIGVLSHPCRKAWRKNLLGGGRAQRNLLPKLVHQKNNTVLSHLDLQSANLICVAYLLLFLFSEDRRTANVIAEPPGVECLVVERT